MELIFGILVGVAIVVILVVLHELGHAIAARRNGVVVEEFGIGFPPRAWAKMLKNKIEFSINWLPLGGFVKLKGEYDSANKKGDYGAATYWQKTKILLAGVAINWLTAALLLTILAWVGLPKILPDQFTVAGDTRVVTHPVEIKVVGGSAAEKGGLKTGDEIVSLAGEKIVTSSDLTREAKAHKSQKVEVVYKRGGAEQQASVTLGDGSKGQGYLGVTAAGKIDTIHATWSAPIVGVGTTVQLTAATFDGLGKLFLNLGNGIASQLSSDPTVKKEGNEELAAAKDSVTGPVGIYGILFPSATSAGPTMLLFITAVISLSLAVVNVLPIPALDGGRWFVMTIFRILKKPLTKEREEKIQSVGFIVLMGLIVVVTIVDVSKLIK